jgi:4-amino-4-deoxy-L-arabinose transferase-like glycosyltransferase
VLLSTAFIFFCVTILFVIRMAGPSDLMDFGQKSPVAYTLDVVKNGHWVVQVDTEGEVTSKPPFYTWLAALGALAGGVNRLTLCLPAFVSTLGLTLAIFIFGRKHFGAHAGFAAALIYAFSPVVAKQVALVRMDGLFSLTIALAAFIAWRAWQTGKGWTMFWVICAFSTLVKGPLGVVLAALGLLAAIWESKSGHPAAVRGSHWIGVLLFFGIAGGWFLLAYWEMGEALVNKMFVRELYQHAVNRGDGRVMGLGFYEPPFYFLTQFAPWSIFCFMAIWRVYRHPAGEANERRLERFLFCWFVAGIVIFSLAAHQRADLIFPLIPAAALLGGREIARLLSAKTDRKFFQIATGVTLVGFILTGLEYGVHRKSDEAVVQTQAAVKLANQIIKQVGKGFPLVHVDSSPVLQMHLDTMFQTVPLERAVQLLDRNAATFVAVKNVDDVLPQINTNLIHILAEGPRTKKTHMAVLGNRPVLGWTDPLATIIGPLRIEMTGVRGFNRRDMEFWFESDSPGAVVELTNESDKSQTARVHFAGRGTSSSEDVSLSPGESRQLRAQK